MPRFIISSCIIFSFIGGWYAKKYQLQKKEENLKDIFISLREVAKKIKK